MTAAVPDRTPAGVEALYANTVMVGRQESSSPAPVTMAEIAAGHAPQLELMELASALEPSGAFVHRNVMAMCSRRAAKSTTIMALLALDAAEHDGVQIYFGRTKPAVKLSIWEKVWKPFCAKHHFKCVHNESMVTTFSSGAIVAFAGTDDVAHVESYLGMKLRRAILDECQSTPPSTLNPLIDRILPPALSDLGGQLVLAGTIPEVPAGKFYETWVSGEGWLKRNWNRFANPHLGSVEHQMGRLQEFLVSSKHKITDPLVRRDWYGEFVFDTSATAYSYEKARNGYKPAEPDWFADWLKEFDGDPLHDHFVRTVRPNDGSARHGVMAAKPWQGVEVYSCAIDPGAKDRFSINVHGWGSGTQKVQHVFEFSSKRRAGLKWSQVAPAMLIIRQHYNPSWWFYDAGGSTVVLDSFVGDTGLPALQPAAKLDGGGLHGQVQRVGDLQLQGILMTMEGSATEEDYEKAMWDPDARAKLKWSWSRLWHPDPSESGRYSLAPYIDIYEAPPDEKTREQEDRERHELAQRRRAARRMGQTLEEDLDAAYDAEEETRWD